jgi:hypothetical protein
LSPISPRRTGHNSSTSPYRSSHRPQPCKSLTVSVFPSLLFF